MNMLEFDKKFKMIWSLNNNLLLYYLFFSGYFFCFIKKNKTILTKNHYKMLDGLDRLKTKKIKNILKLKGVREKTITKDKSQPALLTLEKALFTKYITYTGCDEDNLTIKELKEILRLDLKLTTKMYKQLRAHILVNNKLKQAVRKTKEGKSYRCIIGIKKSINNNCIHSSIG